MTRYSGIDALAKLIDTRAVSQPVADRSARKAQPVLQTAETAQAAKQAADGAQGTLDDVGLPRDDGVPPAAPTGVVVTPGMHALDVTWTEPPAGDVVSESYVEVTPASPGGTPKLYGPFSRRVAGVGNLDGGVACSVRVKLRDRYGRESGFSAPAVSATPELTAAEEVDFEALSMLGRIKTLLPDKHLATIQDATKLGTDVVTARAMATQDAAALNLWVQDAAIQAAKIGSVKADSITTGTLKAATITLGTDASGNPGRLMAGATRIDNQGLTLPTQPDFSTPAADLDSKISNAGRFSAIHFYSVAGHRGMVLRSDGNGATNTVRGNIVLDSTLDGNPGAATAANLNVRSSFASESARVWVRPALEIEGTLIASRSINDTIPANSSAPWTHNLGHMPTIITFYVKVATGWRPLPTSPGSGGIDIYVTNVTATSLTLVNNSAASQTILGYIV